MLHAKYQLAKFGHAQKANFRDLDPAVLTFPFCFLSSPLISLFLPYFFSLARHLVDFILVRKVFGEAFRILGLVERKGMWVVKQFPWNFSGQWYMDFCLFLWSPRMNRAHFGLV